MPQRNVATNFTFEQQRAEINLLAQDFWSQKGTVDTALTTFLKHDGSNNFTGATLAVPNAFTINSNSGNGTVTIAGNLQVDGTTTTVNSATMDVVDKNITIAKGSANDAAADGAGITIDSATDITFNFVDAKDAWVSSIGIEADTFLKAPYGQFTAATTPTTGQGVEVNAPDANTGQIISYDRGNTAYKDLRIKGAGIDFYTGSTNAIVGGFHNTGLVMQSGKTIELDDTIVHSGDSDTKIRFPGANEISFETGGQERLKVSNFGLFVQTGFQLGFLASSGASPSIKSGGTNDQDLLLTSGTNNPTRLSINSVGDVTLGYEGNSLYFENGFNDSNARIQNSGASNNSTLRFYTRNAGTEGERLRIHNDGQITIGNDHAGAGSWDGDLVVANDSGGRITVGDTGSGEKFSIAANGDINLYSYLNGDHINFHTTDGTATSNRMKIQSDGKVAIGNHTAVKSLDIRGTGNQGILVGSTDNSGAQIIIDGNGDGDASGGNYGALEVLNNGDFTIRNHDASQSIIFGVGSAAGANDTLKINSDGQVNLGTSGINQAQFCQAGNNHYIVGQAADNVAALEVYSQHGSSASKISFGVYDNRTGSKSASFMVLGNGTVKPGSDNAQDLGTTTARWANVYTGDMHLNNMNSGGNEVDGSEGHWTMQEGADDLFLINRNTGKKYKFNLTEVS